MRNPLIVATAILGLVAALHFLEPGRAQDRPEPVAAAAAGPSPEAMIEHVFTHFAKAKTGLRVGMSASDAKKVLTDGARAFGTYALPLDATPYGLPGAVGTVFIYSLSDEPDETVSDIHIAFLCGNLGPEDRNALGAKVAALGRKFGFDIEEDDEEPHHWWGSRENPGRTIHVSLSGRGVILFGLWDE